MRQPQLPRRHIETGSMEPLCGNAAVTAGVNSSDCYLCNKRMGEILDLLLDVAEGKPRAAERVQRFLKKVGLSRDDEGSKQ